MRGRRPRARDRADPRRGDGADARSVDQGGAVVVGRRPVLEAVRAGRAREVLVADTARATSQLRDVLSAAESAGVPVTRVPADRVASLAGGVTHQGVLATVDLPTSLGERDLAARAWPARAVAVVLDGVTDPANVGAIARSAEAAGADVLVTRRRRGVAITAVSLRASAGALLHLPVAVVPNIPRALERLKEAGFWVVGLSGDAERTIDEAGRPSGRTALVLGAEGTGLSRLAAERCDELARIPLRGRVGSLNVSAAAAVALFSPSLGPGGKGAIDG